MRSPVMPPESPLPRAVSRELRIGRRRWLQGGTALGLAAAIPGSARADDPPAVELPRILLAGDSMIAGGLGLFMEKDLRKDGYPVHRRGKTSSGLSRPDFFNWMKEATSVVEAFNPDAVVVMFGGNDVQGLYMGGGKWIRFPDERAWSDEYARRVNEFCDIIAPDNEPIFWIGMPVMRPPKFHEKIKRVNTIYRAEMAIRPGAMFIDIWDLMSEGTGEYAHKIAVGPVVEGTKVKRVRVRAGDGIHLSPAGARIVADHVEGIVQQALPAAPNE